MRKVLVVDDSLMIQECIAEQLDEIFQVHILLASNNEEALMHLGSQNIDLIICDYEMPNGKGTDLLEYMQTNNITVPFILFSGRFDLNISIVSPLIKVINDKNYKKLFNCIEILNTFTKK